jgi:putative iron-regulated protein
MTKRLKTWTAVGFAALMTTPADAATQLHTITRQHPVVILGEGGEGGEGGAVEGQIYSLQSTDANAYKFEADDEIEAYADMAQARYAEAAAAAKLLRKACDTLLKAPSEINMSTARTAWIAARKPYMQGEAFRFYDGPIEKLEGAVNEAPITPSVIDDWISRSKAPITVKALAKANQKSAEHDVTTGYHAIEYLLWGADGKRPYTEYSKGTVENDRRRAMLLATTSKLQSDLGQLSSQWSKANRKSYRAKFLKLPEREALGRMVNGMAILAGKELPRDRIETPLAGKDPHDEQSDFSNTTTADFVSGVEGLAMLWRGDGKFRGLAGLVKSRKAEVATQVDAALADLEAKSKALPNPWDVVFAKDATSPERKSADDFSSSLKALAEGLKSAGNALGVLVLLPEE